MRSTTRQVYPHSLSYHATSLTKDGLSMISLCIEDGRTRVGLEISRYKWLITVSKNSLHLSLRLSLDNSADLLVGGLLSKLTGKVNNRYINGWYTECHTSELSLKGRNYLGYSLSSSGGRWDDVSGCSTSSTPVLTGRGVYNSLGSGHSVNGGHKSLLDVELVVYSLNHRCKSVGGKEAQEMKSSDPSCSSAFTPITMVWESSLAGAE